MQDLRAPRGILVGGRGDEDAAFGRATAERLSRPDTKAAVGTLRRPVRFHPVIGAGRNQHRLIGGDPLEELPARSAIPMIVDGGGDQMLMHRERERGRGAMMRQLSQKGAHGAVAHAAAAQVDGNQRRKNFVLFEHVVVLRNEDVVSVAFCRAFGEMRTDDLDERLQVEESRHGFHLIAGICRIVNAAERASNFHM
ncbi:MAG TPA: hypothetical protein VKX28_16875 [Xanthobacteraceae bacterium]|nr:hypothetical protein [Xanthobacteraceae bacterium]